MRGCAPTIRRGRSGTRCSTSATSPASATSGRPRGAGRRASTRGGRSGRSTTARCVAIIEAVRPRMMRRRAGPRSIGHAVYRLAGGRARAAARGSVARAGRREPDDLLVSRMSELGGVTRRRDRGSRVGHKGADLIAPGNTLRELRRRARGRRRHDRVRRPPRARRRSAGRWRTTTRTRRPARPKRSRRRWTTSPASASAGSSSTSTSSCPATSCACSRRCASAVCCIVP